MIRLAPRTPSIRPLLRQSTPSRTPVMPCIAGTSDERVPSLRRRFPSRLSRVATAWPYQSEYLDGSR